ncbi:MAG TPA: DUF5686 and carboxypeptidase regulatory-like domain-containing protein [Puia sp.]|jgi:hypothetical protein|nr:DUF5686 and carboxypeptidase regulatory-like domain-containing protein [Puia sp.]
MTKILLLLSSFLLTSTHISAQRISGSVTDDKGHILPFASLFIKGTTKGTTANNEGKYFINAEPGKQIIICQYVGYERQEKTIIVGSENITANFSLSVQQLSMKEVVIRPGGEDPAYDIIRHAIKKRKDYESPLDSFTCEAYIKTLVKTRKLPTKIFGHKIDSSDKKDMGVDSAGKGIIYLSESLTKVAYKKPGKYKLEILSGRESGSNGYGFNFPTFINFYNNNVTVLVSKLNPRGFVSPIADGALNYYHYKYLGSFVEDGKEINKIKVTPRRRYEPLFSGIINIVDGDWRIHSLDLLLTKTSQLEIMDTVQIKQIQVPVSNNVWQAKDQTVYFTFNLFGFDAVGNFLNVYNKYDINPALPKKYFNNVIIKYDTAINKKSKQYWDSLRPVPLEPEESKDYTIKDSIYHYNKDSLWTKRYTDSLRKHQEHITVSKVLFSGITRRGYGNKKITFYNLDPLLGKIEYNTVEGVAITEGGSIQTSVFNKKELISFSPHIRYGFSNQHFNAWANLQFRKNNIVDDNPYGPSFDRQSWELSGGKRVSQFNNANPISPLMNSVYTLLFKENYMKIYENYFGEIKYSRRMESGLRIHANVLYEDRMPLNNTTDYTFGNYKYRQFTPNYPYEKIDSQFTAHHAFITGAELQYQPGQRFIEFPNRKVSVGSTYPTFSLSYQHGWKNVFNSITDFDKWNFSVWDDVNFKLKGLLSYRFNVGGFLNAASVPIQDYQHFNGNQTIFASQYLNSFQIAPYYANSTTAAFYATGHIEHHFNGMLTNKIPLFKKLNWYLVAGSNAFYVNPKNNYFEIFGGVENIFKLLRVDLVESYLNGHTGNFGIRLGFGGLLGGSIHVNGNQASINL